MYTLKSIKTALKEISDLNKWKDISCLQIRKFNTVKSINILHLIYQHIHKHTHKQTNTHTHKQVSLCQVQEKITFGVFFSCLWGFLSTEEPVSRLCGTSWMLLLC